MSALLLERCRVAEQLLRRARQAVPMTAPRRAVLEVLGDLKAGEWMDGQRLCDLAGADPRGLQQLKEMGLLVARPDEHDMRRRQWALAPLVVPAECGSLNGVEA